MNNAGRAPGGAVGDLDLDAFRALLELNLIAPLALMRAVLPGRLARGSGSIVNVSSATTLIAQPGAGGYAASKAALNMLSDVARVEAAGSGVSISTILPFITDTDFHPGTTATDTAGMHRPEQVADVILDLVRTGEAHADLVPVEYGGSYTGSSAATLQPTGPPAKSARRS